MEGEGAWPARETSWDCWERRVGLLLDKVLSLLTHVPLCCCSVPCRDGTVLHESLPCHCCPCLQGDKCQQHCRSGWEPGLLSKENLWLRLPRPMQHPPSRRAEGGKSAILISRGTIDTWAVT